MREKMLGEILSLFLTGFSNKEALKLKIFSPNNIDSLENLS